MQFIFLCAALNIKMHYTVSHTPKGQLRVQFLRGMLKALKIIKYLCSITKTESGNLFFAAEESSLYQVIIRDMI